MKQATPDPARELAADYSRRAAAYARYWAPVIQAAAPAARLWGVDGAEGMLRVEVIYGIAARPD